MYFLVAQSDFFQVWSLAVFCMREKPFLQHEREHFEESFNNPIRVPFNIILLWGSSILWLLGFELCPVQPSERILVYTGISTDVVYLRSDLNYKIKSDSSSLLLKSNLFYSCYIPNALRRIWHIVGGQSILVDSPTKRLPGLPTTVSPKGFGIK